MLHVTHLFKFIDVAKHADANTSNERGKYLQVSQESFRDPAVDATELATSSDRRMVPISCSSSFRKLFYQGKGEKRSNGAKLSTSELIPIIALGSFVIIISILGYYYDSYLHRIMLYVGNLLLLCGLLLLYLSFDLYYRSRS